MNANASQGIRLLAAAALMVASSLAHAQYIWIDEKGLKQLSDRPPPTSVPLKNILKVPGTAKGPVLVPIEAPPAAAAAAPAGKAKDTPTLAERNADYRKRMQEQGEREQKARDEEDNKTANAANCEAARDMKQTLDSGVRIGISEKNGERGYMNDGQRAQEAKKVNKVLAGCR